MLLVFTLNRWAKADKISSHYHSHHHQSCHHHQPIHCRWSLHSFRLSPRWKVQNVIGNKRSVTLIKTWQDWKTVNMINYQNLSESIAQYEDYVALLKWVSAKIPGEILAHKCAFLSYVHFSRSSGTQLQTDIAHNLSTV